MKVLVLGATGSVGSAVVRSLLKGGASVAALTRSADKAKTLPAGVEARIGDLNDPYKVGDAFKGVDAVFLLNAVSPTETQEGLFAPGEREATEKLLGHPMRSFDAFAKETASQWKA